MKIVKSFNKNPLGRIIFESIRIAQRPSEESLNSKQEYASSGLITARFESDLTQKKNEKVIIKEAINAKDRNEKMINTENSNNKIASNVKTKVLEIENKLQSEGKNVNKISKFFVGKKDEKWPPPKGGGGVK